MKAQSNGVVLGNSSLTVVFYVRVRVCRKHTDYRGNAISLADQSISQSSSIQGVGRARCITELMRW